jgi:hypothetical protein
LLEIRKNPEVRSTVYITDINLKVPADGSWMPIPITVTKNMLENSNNLKQAYEYGLIDINVQGSYSQVPDWYYDPYHNHVKVPVNILKGKEQDVLHIIEQYRKDAHPIMWYIIRTGLLIQEAKTFNRPLVLAALEQESDYRRRNLNP